MDAEAKPYGGVKRELGHELKESTFVSLYFSICIAAILFYKTSELQAGEIG